MQLKPGDHFADLERRGLLLRTARHVLTLISPALLLSHQTESRIRSLHAFAQVLFLPLCFQVHLCCKVLSSENFVAKKLVVVVRASPILHTQAIVLSVHSFGQLVA